MKHDLVSGSYRLLGELNDASRPGVHLAHGLLTGELVLLALPGPETTGPTAEALRQEGSVFGEIACPQVQGVVDWDPEVPFVAWEYVTGWPLTAALRNGPEPDLAAVLSLMEEVAQGLVAVHARGAIYCGLHPSRILVLRDGSARLTTTPHAVLSARGDRVRVPPPVDTPVPYLAPEQIDGSVDVRSDLFALGVVGYELLTGDRLFRDLDPIAQALQIQGTDHPAPSARRPGVPEGIDELFAALLARDPAERPASAERLVTELARLRESAVAPDSQPLAAFLGAVPVVTPLLAEDATGSAVFEALQAQTSRPGAVAQEPKDQNRQPAQRRAYRSAAARSSTAEEVDEQQQGRLIGPDGEVFALEGTRVIVGRVGAGAAPDVDLADLDKQKVVSREHAVLDLGERRWYVSELRARNGTWLNGERVRKGSFLRLRRGDQLKIANITLSYTVVQVDHADEVAVPASPPPLEVTAGAEHPAA